MNVVLYLRYSSAAQTEQSIEGQDRDCTAYCERMGYTIVGKYIDRAISGTSAEKREEFKQMISDSAKHTFQAVIVWKLDRFARNQYDHAINENKLNKNNVKLISAMENISEGPQGRLMQALLIGIAEYYSADLKEKVTRGLRETALKGNNCGGTMPLGYRVENKKLVIDDATAFIVREAFNRFAEGESVAQIAQSFNAKGYLTTRHHPFNKNSFRMLLQNKKYIGTYCYNGIEIENAVPAIIDKELFDRAAKRISIQKKTRKGGTGTMEYLLSGKAFCGNCGGRLIGESGHGRSTTYYYYTCQNRKNRSGCKKSNIDKDTLENWVVEETVKLITPEFVHEAACTVAEFSRKQIEENKTVPALKARLSEIGKRLSNLARALEDGAAPSTVVQRMTELESERSAVQLQLDHEMQNLVPMDEARAEWFLSMFCNGDPNDPDFRRRLINILVNKVTVYDLDPHDGKHFRIMITYNLPGYESDTTLLGSDEVPDGSPALKHTNHNTIKVNYGKRCFTIIFEKVK